ncbi:MAG: 2Fe-2S iron-sulfur cluster-binding protein, partial [Bdellovibrionia bacterium]
MLKNKSHLTIEWNGAQYLIEELKAGETLLELALRKDWPIDHSCGGNGTCGTCRVRVV